MGAFDTQGCRDKTARIMGRRRFEGPTLISFAEIEIRGQVCGPVAGFGIPHVAISGE